MKKLFFLVTLTTSSWAQSGSWWVRLEADQVDSALTWFERHHKTVVECITLFEGYSLRLPKHLQYFIGATKGVRHLEASTGITPRHLLQGLKPKGQWSYDGKQDWQAEVELRHREIVLMWQAKLLKADWTGPTPLADCQSNLKNLSTALEMYAADHQGQYPKEIKSLLSGHYLHHSLTCPLTGKPSYLLRARKNGYQLLCSGNHRLKAQLSYDSDQGFSPQVSSRQLRQSVLRSLGPDSYHARGSLAWKIEPERLLLASRPELLGQSPVCPAPLPAGMVQVVHQEPNGQVRAFSWQPGGGRALWTAQSGPSDLSPARYLPAAWGNALVTQIAPPLQAGHLPEPFPSLSDQLAGPIAIGVPTSAAVAALQKNEHLQLALACRDELISQTRSNSADKCPVAGQPTATAGPNGHFYCKGHWHKAADLKENEPSSDQDLPESIAPPYLVVASLKDPVRVAQLCTAWPTSQWKIVPGNPALLLWSNQPDLLTEASQISAEQSMLSHPNFKKALAESDNAACSVEVCDLREWQAALGQTRSFKFWQSLGQSGELQLGPWRELLDAVSLGPLTELLGHTQLQGYSWARPQGPRMEYQRQGGLPLLPLLVAYSQVPIAAAPTPLQHCQSNLKNLATALEMYASDYQGHYPNRLSDLSPNYILKLPSCPTARQETYSATYQVSQKPDAFSLHCGGKQHTPVPHYTSRDGLTEK
jgi:hypothetical protein